MIKSASARPLVTFAVIAYNQEDYIREAIEGAFSQTYEPLEIILSDDCSTDRTYEIMCEMSREYRGSHKIVLRRPIANQGLGTHFSEIVQMASADLIVLAAGDDISLPQRTAVSVKPLIDHSDLNFTDVRVENFQHETRRHLDIERYYERDLADCVHFDLNSVLQGENPTLVGAGRTIRRSALTRFPGLSPSCPTEDTTSIIRLLMTGRGCKIDSMLVLRRIHGQNLSITGFNQISKLMAIQDQYCADVKFMLRRGLIDKQKAKRIIDWSSDRIVRKSQGILFGYETSWPAKIVRFVLSREIPVSLKIRSLKRFFIDKSRGLRLR